MKRMIVALYVCFSAQSLMGMQHDCNVEVLNDLSAYLHEPVLAFPQNKKLSVDRHRKKTHRKRSSDKPLITLLSQSNSRFYPSSSLESSLEIPLSSQSSHDESINRLIEYADIRNITKWLKTSSTYLMRDALQEELMDLRDQKRETFNKVIALIPKNLHKEVPNLTVSLFRLALQVVQDAADALGKQAAKQAKQIQSLTRRVEDCGNEISLRDHEIKRINESINHDELRQQMNGLRNRYIYYVNEYKRRTDWCRFFSCYIGCFAWKRAQNFNTDLEQELTDTRVHEDRKSDVDDVYEEGL